jgi:hypothetical protein
MATRRKRTRRARQARQARQAKTRARRQRGGTNDEEIRALVHHYFPEFSEGIRVDKGHVFLTCPAASHANADPDPNFTHFHITDDYMMLHYLKRCPTIQGTDILQRIIAIGRALSLHTIELDDASLVGCDFPLYTLSILQRGETWYHRMGFRSPTSAEDKQEQDRLRHLPFDDFVHEMFRAHDARIGREDTETIKQRARAYLKTWYRTFPEIEQKRRHTVAEIVGMIHWKDIPCDHPRATLLRNFLFMADSALPYDSHVTLDLRPQNA